MSTNFPTSLDSYTDRVAGDTIVETDVNNPHDAVEAIEAKVGVNSSAVTTSLDYILKNTTGGHDHDGSDSKILGATGISAVLGSWVDKSGGYGAQQATTDGFVLAYTANLENEFTIDGYTDAVADPTTLIAHSKVRPYGTTGSANIMFPVKKNHYWKVVLTNVTIGKVYWIPLGV